jgi:hypothetical protein
MGTQNYAPQNGAPPSAPASGIFKPRVGFPEIVALAFDQGKIVTSHLDGSSQVLLTFTDGRRWYVSLFTADRIHEAGILARQQFEVTKLGRGANDWQIVPLPAHPGAASAASPAPTHNGNSSGPPQPERQPAAQPAPSFTAQPNPASARMMACFLVAIDAIAEAQQNLQRRGIGITLSGDNITSAALSCYISQMRKEGC